MIDSLRQDVRHALRAFARRPGLALAAVLTLALGTGANTAVFTVVDRALLRSLPYHEADRLVMLWEKEKDGGQSNTGYATFEDWQARTHSFSSMAAMSYWMPTLSGSGEPERIDGQRVTRDFFKTLGVTPALGRDFTAEENVRGNHRVVILSDGLFQRRFGGDRSLLNHTLLIGDTPFTVVGVLPKSFESLIEPKAQMWAPLAYNDSLPQACRTCRHLRTIARLAPGVLLPAAAAEMDALSRQLFAEHPQDYAAPGTIVRPLQAEIAGPVRPALVALLLAVAFVLLIACVNVANLLLSWASERHREIAIRVALGATRARIARRLLTESVLLSLAGGALGLLVALWGAPWLLARVPAAVPRFDGLLIDLRVFAFTFLISALTGIVFGLVPALAASRPGAFEAMKIGAAGAPGGRQRLRQTLVAAEVGLALVLLAGAGLLVKSFIRLVSVDAGFDISHLLTAEISTSGSRFSKDEVVLSFYEQVLERVRALPGVESAGVVSQLPLGGDRDGFGMHIEDRPLANEADAPDADRYSVSTDYLKTMRIPVLLGRTFTADDRADAPLVVLINDTFARRIWPGQSPIGKRLKLGDLKIPWRTIVGVVGDVKHSGLDGASTMQIYLPQPQFVDNTMILAVRSRTDPAALAAGVRSVVRSVDPGQPVSKVATMREVVSASTAPRRLTMTVFAAFAAAALLLAAVGIYGVISASVTQRTREIGIRMALGAPRSGILQLVMARVVSLTLAGGAAGLVLTLALSRSLRGLLFEVAPTDPATLLSVAALLLSVALLAAFVPARRALRVDPAVALRSE